MFHCHVGFFQGTPGPCALPQSWPSVEVDACKSPARKCPNPELGRCILTHAYRYLLISIDLIYPSSASYPSYPSLYLGHLPVFLFGHWFHALLITIAPTLDGSRRPRCWVNLQRKIGWSPLDHAPDWTTTHTSVETWRVYTVYTISSIASIATKAAQVPHVWRSQCDLRGPWSVPSLWRRKTTPRASLLTAFSFSLRRTRTGITGPRSPFFYHHVMRMAAFWYFAPPF